MIKKLIKKLILGNKGKSKKTFESDFDLEEKIFL